MALSASRSERGSSDGAKGGVQDQLFCRVFRTEEGGPLDRLTLLACVRQGLLPDDLLYLPKGETSPHHSANRSPSVSVSRSSKVTSAMSDARYHAQEMRRQQYIDIVEREREGIIDILKSNDGRRRMHHDLQTVHTQLLKQPEDCQSNVVEEGSLIEALLLRESDHQAHISRVKAAVEKATSSGEADIDKLQRRQIRAITTEIKLETERDQIFAQLKAAEETWHAKQEQRKKELAYQNKIASRRREFKVLRLQQRQDEKYIERKTSLEERQRRRDDLAEELKWQKEQLLQERHEEAEQQIEHVKKQANHVRDEEMSKCRLLQHEQEAKLGLHNERKRNLNLRLDAAREMRRIESTKRHLAVKEHLNEKETDDRKEAEELQQSLETATDRKKYHDGETRLRYKEIVNRHRESTANADRRRKQQEEEKELRNQEIRDEEMRKEEHIFRLQQEKVEEQELRKARHIQEREQHIHNTERLKRLDEYKQRIKDARLAEELAHMQEHERRKREMAHRLHTARLRISQGKERVVDKFMKLRRSSAWKSNDALQLIEKEMHVSTERRPKTSSTTTRAAHPTPSRGYEEEKSAPRGPTTPIGEMMAKLEPTE